MKYELTKNETWTLALLTMIATPIIANKSDRYPLDSIIKESPLYGSMSKSEILKIKSGFEALSDIGVISIEQSFIVASEITDFIYQALGYISSLSYDEAMVEMDQAPKFVSVLKKINDDPRLSPEPLNRSYSTSYNEKDEIIDNQETSIFAKIGYSIFTIFVLLGLLNAAIKYLS